MGYCASSVDVDFTIPADKVAAALRAVNAQLSGTPEELDADFSAAVAAAALEGDDEDAVDAARSVLDESAHNRVAGYPSLSAALEDYTCFEDNREDESGFTLGYHTDKYLSLTDEILETLAPFAMEGSYVRFSGEDDALWGYKVVGGQLRGEHVEWILDKLPSRTQ